MEKLIGKDLLKGTKILYVGCSRGIGFETVKVFVEEGADVVGFSRRMSEEKIKEVQNSGEGTFTFLSTDVSSDEAVQTNVDKAAEIMGGIDGVVCGQLTYWAMEAEDLTIDDFNEMYDMVALGTVRVNQACLPYLKESKLGTILNYASGAGITTKTPGPDPAHYCMAKAAVIMWTKCIAREWAKYGITANCPCPMIFGEAAAENINTPELKAWFDNRCEIIMDLPYEMGKARDHMAPYIVFLMTPYAKWITAQELNCDGGMVESR